ncbi:VOC family protein [Paenibacillus montanisoli]|uniref:Glyoxalase/fosfomycin resistance/dioxygenase domain-containing protein n=1 Tax=Paenibacillus montanisoli TaxID=2081970 RepID=A0A328U263_9BACL|nr:VOC family protein [Paenibacillus montanisoli]RAP75863.1 hypothetical protein DL346_10535 [Paenibacillus montanisoli]
MLEQMKATPIKPILPAVFVYVTDIKQSVDWYCRLLGLPSPETAREDIHIFNFSDSRCSNLFLEKREKVDPSTAPMFSLTAPDHQSALQFLTDLGVEIVYKDAEVIHFKDLDGNVLMACSI